MSKYAALNMMHQTQSVASLIDGGAKMADTVHVPGVGFAQVNYAPSNEQKLGPDGTVEMRANPLDQMRVQAQAEVAQRKAPAQQSRNRLLKDFSRRTGPGLSAAAANSMRAAPLPMLQRAARNNMRGMTTINSLTPTQSMKPSAMKPAAKALTQPAAKVQPVANVGTMLQQRIQPVRRMAVGMMQGGLAEAYKRLNVSTGMQFNFG